MTAPIVGKTLSGPPDPRKEIAMPAVYQRDSVTEAQVAFLREPNYAVVAALRSDGSPHQTVTWVDWDGEHVVVNTSDERAKRQYLERDPRVSVLVLDRENPYRWLSISGRAELTTEGAAEHVNELAHKYRGRDYEFREGEERVIVRVKPKHVTAYEV
jgi:PPOX class probable F420-dependent enzyme